MSDVYLTSRNHSVYHLDRDCDRVGETVWSEDRETMDSLGYEPCTYCGPGHEQVSTNQDRSLRRIIAAGEIETGFE